MDKIHVAKEINLEVKRKTIHAIITVAFVLLYIILGTKLLLFIAFLLLIGVVLTELCIRGYNLPLISYFIKNFDRPEDVLFRPGLGVFTLVIGITSVLLIKTAFFLMEDKAVILSMLLCVTDVSSTVFGLKFGKHKWFYNKRKSIEGSIANFLTGFLLTYLFYKDLLTLIIIPLITSIIESLPKLDDNINIPLFASITLLMLGKFY